MIKKIMLILFDCDGTLLKTLGFGMDAWNQALASVGSPVFQAQEITKFFGRSADKIFFELLKDRKKACNAYEYYLQFETKHVHRIVAHDGVVQLLDILRDNNVRMGVVTGRHSRDLDILFNQTGLHKYFEVLICDDKLINSKPHPEGILSAAAQLKVDTCDCIYVGDSVMDMEAAKASGAKSVAALWDQYVDVEKMHKTDPNFKAHTPQELWKWLNF